MPPGRCKGKERVSAWIYRTASLYTMHRWLTWKSATVFIAEAKHILRVDVGPFHGGVGLFKKGKSLGRAAQAEETHTAHLDRLAIVRILIRGFSEGCNSLRELLLLVKYDAAQPFHTGGLGDLRGQLIKLRQRLVQASPCGQV